MKKITNLLLFLLCANVVVGQFGLPIDITRSTSKPADVLTIDLDNDGDDDIICYSGSDGKLSLYENQLGLNFSKQKILGIKPLGGRIHSVDIDNDGDFDFLLTIQATNQVGWFENLGGFNFSNFKTISNLIAGAEDVFTADIDNDGDQDVIACSQTDNKITWFENLGNGLFGAQNIIQNFQSSSTHYIYLIDIDGDSNIDIFSAHSSAKWYKNNGSGSFSTNPIASYTWPARSIQVKDIDGDGILDALLTTHYETIWYKNTGGGVFSSNKNTIGNNFNYGMASVATDLDNDGDNDVINVSIFDNKVILYENIGGGFFSNEILISTSTDGVRSVFVSDIDGDGRNDVISASELDNKVAWYRNLGNGDFDTQIVLSDSIPQPRNVISEDINNDGYKDIIVISNGKIVWFENLGLGNFTSEIIISSSFPSGCEIKAIDIDNDGDLDIIASKKNTLNPGAIVWLQNLGNGNIDTTQNIILSNLYGYVSLDSKDIDGDSMIDVIFSSNGNNVVGWLKNLGGGFFNSSYSLVSGNNSPHSVFSVDIDNDGDFDILSAHHLSWGRIGLALNTGSGTFVTGYSFNFEAPRDVFCTDIDGDGDVDVIGATDDGIDNNFSIAWYENLGGVTFGSKKKIFTNSGDGLLNIGGGFLYAEDLDNDGDKDILLVNELDDKITWFENFHFSPYQLRGNLYYDANQNKIKDTNEIGLSFIQMQLQPTGQSCYTSTTGQYIFAPDTGAYLVNYVPNTLWNLTTDSISYNRNLTGASPLVDSLDFGFFPDTIFTSIQTDFTGGFPRCNDIINYWIDIHNQGTTLPSGVIHVQLDDSVDFVSAAFTPDSIVGQNIYWSYDSLFFYSHLNINQQVTMPPFTSMGDTLTSYLTVYELDGFGNVIYTNTDSLNQVSVCAYDPNDKSVLPKGVGVEGFILNDEPFLEYLIRFQNTGNDTAITVMVRDQLDSNLDWNSIQIISHSHNMQAWIEQDGEAVFKFEKIILPDSGVDFIASQGYVKFRINLKPNIISGTQIFNKSNIYFDSNPPVITNVVLNTVYDCENALVNIVNSPTCFGENLVANSPEGSIINYFWEIDSFYTDSTATLSWQADTVGVFDLKLTINNPICSKDTTVSITIHPSVPITTINQSICQGDSIQIGGLFQTSAGTYYDSLQTINGCDSVLSITLSVNPIYLSNTNDTVCQGDSVLIYGNYENTAGVYYDTLQTILGCDSVLATTLFLNANFNTSQNQEICQGDSIILGGSYQTIGGVYYDSLQTINGCDSVLSTTLTVNSLPNVTLANFNPDTICSSGSVVGLPNGSPSGGVYSGTGVNGGTFDPNTAGLGTHSVFYTYTDINSCINSDSTFITVEQCVGMDDLAKDLGILIYPNPNTGLFTIEKSSKLDKEVKVSLLDATSRVIIDKLIPKGQQKIEMDITSYSKGIYYLQLTIGDKVYVKKVLKN